jgi:hypothetical protein
MDTNELETLGLPKTFREAESVDAGLMTLMSSVGVDGPTAKYVAWLYGVIFKDNPDAQKAIRDLLVKAATFPGVPGDTIRRWLVEEFRRAEVLRLSEGALARTQEAR